MVLEAVTVVTDEVPLQQERTVPAGLHALVPFGSTVRRIAFDHQVGFLAAEHSLFVGHAGISPGRGGSNEETAGMCGTIAPKFPPSWPSIAVPDVSRFVFDPSGDGKIGADSRRDVSVRSMGGVTP